MVLFSSLATLEAGRQWKNVFKSQRENHFQPRIPYPAELSLRVQTE